MKDLAGAFTALVTPFKNGEVDFDSLKRLLRFQMDSGIDGFVINGTTAESPTLSDREKKNIFEFVRSETSGQVPLVMGTGNNSTSDTIMATRTAAEMKADAALVVVPYYNKPPQRGLFQHYQKVAECSDLPVILYNVPSRTVAKLELDTIAELSRLRNIAGIKEATGDVVFARRIIEESSPGFLVTSGDDGTFIDLIGAGGQGVISVASNILPKLFTDWCRRARKGDPSPRDEFAFHAELISYLYVESNPIPIKAALHKMGLIDSPELRLPLTTLAEPFAAQLKIKMQAVGLP